MNPDRIVFFDWGGVVTDDAGDNFFLQLLIEIGASQELAQKILRAHWNDLMCGRIDDREFWQTVETTYKLMPVNMPEKQSHWAGLTPNPEMMKFITDLRRRGVRVAALTNVIRSSFDILQEKGCYDSFEFVIASCNEGFSKPRTEIFHAALQKGRVSPEQCIFVDDKERNTDAAKKLGFQIVLAQNTQQTIKDIERNL